MKVHKILLVSWAFKKLPFDKPFASLRLEGNFNQRCLWSFKLPLAKVLLYFIVIVFAINASWGQTAYITKNITCDIFNCFN